MNLGQETLVTARPGHAAEFSAGQLPQYTEDTLVIHDEVSQKYFPVSSVAILLSQEQGGAQNPQLASLAQRQGPGSHDLPPLPSFLVLKMCSIPCSSASIFLLLPS